MGLTKTITNIYGFLGILCKFAKKTMMNSSIPTICTVVLLFCGIIANAQPKTYPEDMLNYEYPYFVTVEYEGASPGIVDFVTSLLNTEGVMFMESDDFFDAWNHYLRHEPQEPGSEIFVDEKNGYVYMESSFQSEFEGEPSEMKSFYEMCYWNCADKKHKLFAMTSYSMINGRYVEGQATGLSTSLYENARHIMWDVNEGLLGLEVDSGTDECYEGEATGIYHVRDRETGEPLTLNSEEFYRWLEEKPVVVYRLPRQGKDIIAEIHYATRTDTIRLVWDGMRFNRQ